MPSRNEQRYNHPDLLRTTLLEQDADRAEQRLDEHSARMDAIEDKQGATNKLLIGFLVSLALVAVGLAVNVLSR